MKHSLLSLVVLLLSLNHIACDGTEVGNGRTRPTTQNSSTPDKSDGSPTTDSDTDSEGGSENPAKDNGGEMSTFIAESYLLVDCASPLAEAKAGEFYDPNTDTTLQVKAGTGTNLSVTVGSKAYTISKAITSEKPYGVSVSPKSTLSCTSVTTEGLKRTVVYSDNATLVWTVDSQGFTSEFTISKEDEIVREFSIKTP